MMLFLRLFEEEADRDRDHGKNTGRQQRQGTPANAKQGKSNDPGIGNLSGLLLSCLLRLIYSPVLGFLGGDAWCITSAGLCGIADRYRDPCNFRLLGLEPILQSR